MCDPSLCGHGTCVGDICVCDAGWSSRADMMTHLLDQRCIQEISMVGDLWIFTLLLGIICMILGVIKLRSSILQNKPDIAPAPVILAGPNATTPVHAKSGKKDANGGNNSPKVGNGNGTPKSHVNGANGNTNGPTIIIPKNTGADSSYVPGSPSVGRASRSIGGGVSNASHSPKTPKNTKFLPTKGGPYVVDTATTAATMSTDPTTTATTTPDVPLRVGIMSPTLGDDTVPTHPGPTTIPCSPGTPGATGAPALVRRSSVESINIASNAAPRGSPKSKVMAITTTIATAANGGTGPSSSPLYAPLPAPAHAIGMTPLTSSAGVAYTSELSQHRPSMNGNNKDRDTNTTAGEAKIGVIVEEPHGTGRDKDESSANSSGTGIANGVNISVQPTRRNYRRWMTAASATLSFRMGMCLELLGICKFTMGCIRVYDPEHAISHHWPITFVFCFYIGMVFHLSSSFCLAWMGMYNALASFMPSAGVTPMKYGSFTFQAVRAGFWCLATLPIIIKVAPSSASEGLYLFFWIAISVLAIILTSNFYILGTHVIKLLNSHIASMEATPHMIAARGPAGVIMIVNVQAKQRLEDLQLVVSRLKGIVRSLWIGGGISISVFLIGIIVPWLRYRTPYYLPFVWFINAQRAVIATMSMKYTVASLEGEAAAAALAPITNPTVEANKKRKKDKQAAKEGAYRTGGINSNDDDDEVAGSGGWMSPTHAALNGGGSTNSPKGNPNGGSGGGGHVATASSRVPRASANGGVPMTPRQAAYVTTGGVPTTPSRSVHRIAPATSASLLLSSADGGTTATTLPHGTSNGGSSTLHTHDGFLSPGSTHHNTSSPSPQAPLSPMIPVALVPSTSHNVVHGGTVLSMLMTSAPTSGITASPELSATVTTQTHVPSNDLNGAEDTVIGSATDNASHLLLSGRQFASPFGDHDDGGSDQEQGGANGGSGGGGSGVGQGLLSVRSGVSSSHGEQIHMPPGSTPSPVAGPLIEGATLPATNSAVLTSFGALHTIHHHHSTSGSGTPPPIGAQAGLSPVTLAIGTADSPSTLPITSINGLMTAAMLPSITIGATSSSSPRNNINAGDLVVTSPSLSIRPRSRLLLAQHHHSSGALSSPHHRVSPRVPSSMNPLHTRSPSHQNGSITPNSTVTTIAAANTTTTTAAAPPATTSNATAAIASASAAVPNGGSNGVNISASIDAQLQLEQQSPQNVHVLSHHGSEASASGDIDHQLNHMMMTTAAVVQ